MLKERGEESKCKMKLRKNQDGKETVITGQSKCSQIWEHYLNGKAPDLVSWIHLKVGHSVTHSSVIFPKI